MPHSPPTLGEGLAVVGMVQGHLSVSRADDAVVSSKAKSLFRIFLRLDPGGGWPGGFAGPLSLGWWAGAFPDLFYI